MLKENLSEYEEVNYNTERNSLQQKLQMTPLPVVDIEQDEVDENEYTIKKLPQQNNNLLNQSNLSVEKPNQVIYLHRRSFQNENSRIYTKNLSSKLNQRRIQLQGAQAKKRTMIQQRQNFNFVAVKKFINRIKQISPFQNKPPTEYQEKLISDRSSGIQIQEQLNFGQNNDQQCQGQLVDKKNYNNKNYSSYLCFSRLKPFALELILHKTINPENEILLVWFILRVILTIFIFFHHSICLTFGLQFQQNIFNPQTNNHDGYLFLRTICIYFILDIFVSVKTGYYVNGEPIIDQQIVMKNYIKENFIYDFLPVLVLIIEQGELSLQHDSLYTHILSILIFTKMQSLQLALKQISYLFSDNFKDQIILKLISVTFSILIYSHIVGSLWFIVGSINERQDTWINKINIQHETWWVKYIYSVYWSVTTMSTVGYGDITPQNEYEVLFVVLNMLVSSMVFAYSLNTIGGIISDVTKNKSRISLKLAILNNYLKRNKITKPLQTRIKQYLMNIWELQSSYQNEEEEILQSLSQPLKQQMQINIYQKFISKIPFFEKYQIYFSKSFLNELISNIQETRYPQHSYIITTGKSENQELYFFLEGQATKMVNFKKRQVFLNNVEVGDIIGQERFFYNEVHPYSVVTKSPTTVGKLDRQIFLNLLIKYPDDNEIFHMLNDQLIFRGVKSCINVGIKCEGCESEFHHFGQCPQMNFILDKYMVIQKYLHSNQQNRFKYSRQLKRSMGSRNCFRDLEDQAEQLQLEYESFINELYQDQDFKLQHSVSLDSNSQDELQLLLKNQLSQNNIHHKKQDQVSSPQINHANSSGENYFIHPSLDSNNNLKSESLKSERIVIHNSRSQKKIPYQTDTISESLEFSENVIKIQERKSSPKKIQSRKQITLKKFPTYIQSMKESQKDLISRKSIVDQSLISRKFFLIGVNKFFLFFSQLDKPQVWAKFYPNSNKENIIKSLIKFQLKRKRHRELF